MFPDFLILLLFSDLTLCHRQQSFKLRIPHKQLLIDMSGSIMSKPLKVKLVSSYPYHRLSNLVTSCQSSLQWICDGLIFTGSSDR